MKYGDKFYTRKLTDEVNEWKLEIGGDIFIWRVSSKFTPDKFKYDIREIRGLACSDITMSAKALFLFIMSSRFGETSICLYSRRQMSERTGMSYNTVIRAIKELCEAGVLEEAKYNYNGVFQYQYRIKDYSEWKISNDVDEIQDTKSEWKQVSPPWLATPY